MVFLVTGFFDPLSGSVIGTSGVTLGKKHVVNENNKTDAG
jgi:hypothetical protein